jgi:hypothetical protein
MDMRQGSRVFARQGTGREAKDKSKRTRLGGGEEEVNSRRLLVKVGCLLTPVRPEVRRGVACRPDFRQIPVL